MTVRKLNSDKEAEDVTVNFTRSNIKHQWEKGGATLLEIAEEEGLTPNFSCRNGVCGSCATILTSGSVTYRTQAIAEHANNEILICCAVPAKGSDTLDIDL